MELAAIWGSDGVGEKRFPKRRRINKKSLLIGNDSTGPVAENLDELLSDMSDREDEDRNDDRTKEKVKEKKAKKSVKANKEYRLHCFVEPGTEKNDVRTVFEAYNPKVELRTSQKGNLLNKTQYAVLTFSNKAMALHAVKMLDGTNQRDLLGTPKLKLRLMLTREQNRIARRKVNAKIKKNQEQRLVDEAREDTEFIKRFLRDNLKH